jgi:NAD(P)-dependent dehydrogenase (short-subunit alcohol dehydrogenase family)
VLLTGKVGIVTGAASSMGREAAVVFAQEGARVVCADRDLAGAEKVSCDVSDRGADALAVEVDVTRQVSTRGRRPDAQAIRPRGLPRELRRISGA